jgi:hypothetical protein
MSDCAKLERESFLGESKNGGVVMECLPCGLRDVDGKFCSVCGSELTKSVTTCVSCGEFPLHGTYCHNCGSSQKAQDACPKCRASGQTELFCTACGYEISDKEPISAAEQMLMEPLMKEAVWCKLCKDWTPRYDHLGEQMVNCAVCSGPDNYLNFNKTLK